MARTALALFLFGLAIPLAAQNCANTSVGFTPLNEMSASQMYWGYPGSLYPGGNAVPATHLTAGLAQASQVVPRNALGQPDPFGHIGLLSIGMSNATSEYSMWMPMAAADPLKNPRVKLVDGAIGGVTAALIANPNDPYWGMVDQRLLLAQLSAQQVQVIWLKTANAGPTSGFPAATQQLRDNMRSIVQILRTRFPNARLCYCSSRIYAGYASTTLNPEPYAYQSGFAVRWLIEAQLNGDPLLNYNSANGVPTAPWLAWGPYLWGDGTTPRLDGLVWNCSDFNSDGTHPSNSGRQKVANLLQAHFSTHATTAPWYYGYGAPLALVTNYGTGCAGTNGVPQINTNTIPWLGNSQFTIRVTTARPASPATLFLSLAQAQIPLGAGCTVWIDPFAANLLLPQSSVPTTVTTSAQGMASLPFPLPALPALAGFTVFAQWVINDPLGAGPGFALTNAARIRLGTSN